MNIPTLVYKRLLDSSGLTRKFWSVFRKLLIKLLRDPSCVLTVHAHPLQLPLSHRLPIYLKDHPFYDRLPERISGYIHDKYGYIKCVDVGANIGDSIAAFYKDDVLGDRFLAIEPNENFNRYLVANWGGKDNVRILTSVCSSENRTRTYQVFEEQGTASLVNSENGVIMETRSLDDIISNNP